jgi:hypothetical protein
MAGLFLIFEPTNHIFLVAAAARRRGFDVVAFHAQPLVRSGPYAAGIDALSEQHSVPSWSHEGSAFEAILQACAGRPVAGTYAAHEATLEVEARVQEYFGLPTKGYNTVRALLNKRAVRERLRAAGLSALELAQPEEVLTLQRWPLPGQAMYFKPVRGSGSAYVKRCQSLDDVQLATTLWQAREVDCGRLLQAYVESSGCFLEREAVGQLMSLEGYVHNGHYSAIGLTSRTVLEADVAVEMGAVFPYFHPRHSEIVTHIAAVHRCLEIAHGATHVEVMVPTAGPIEVVEVNARFVGADVAQLVNAAYAIRIEDALVALALGEHPALDLQTRQGRFACLQYVLAPQGLTRVESIDLPRELEFEKIIKPPGTALASTEQQADWVAGFIVCGTTYQEALERGLEARRRVRVNGCSLDHDRNNRVIAG